MNKIKVTHIITCLDTGGAEMMLYKLLSSCDRNNCSMSVISLSDIGEIGKKIQGLDVSVTALNARKSFAGIFSVFKLIKILRKEKPDIIQTWMYHANFLGAIATLFVKKAKLIWGIHNGYLDKNRMKRATVLVAKICAWLSYLIPKKIVCCAKATVDIHAKFGYASSKMIVIPNGFDLQTFQYNSEFYQDVRKELRLPSDSLLIGMLARFDADKDYPNFMHASQQIMMQNPTAYFICCGKNVDNNNAKLVGLIEKYKLQNRCYLLGERRDVVRLLSAFDVLVSSSVSEGFSNVIGEAMACEVPCVVTNVGDSAEIVCDKNCVVPSQNSQELARAVQHILCMNAEQRKLLGKAARIRIKDNYSLEKIVQEYQNLYQELGE
ncbi:MAG: glycosyltransferase [Gammaproteobacteria bacterium]|jgi:glycosyltransferase involved in cell wall biosynthesis